MVADRDLKEHTDLFLCVALKRAGLGFKIKQMQVQSQPRDCRILWFAYLSIFVFLLMYWM